MNKLLFILLALVPLLLVMVAPTVYAFKAFNVNLNKIIDLPEQPLYPNTTLQPGYPNCAHSTDVFADIKNIQKEKAQNPAMFKSDAVLAVSIGNASFTWCGIEK